MTQIFALDPKMKELHLKTRCSPFFLQSIHYSAQETEFLFQEGKDM